MTTELESWFQTISYDDEGDWESESLTEIDPDEDEEILQSPVQEPATRLNLDGQHVASSDFRQSLVYKTERPDDLNISTKAIIMDADGRILLIRDVATDFWDLPGGHMTENETSEAALRREVMEETGIDLSDIRISQLFVRTMPLGKTLKPVFFYLVILDHQPRVTLSEEHSKYVWATREEIRQSNLGVFKDILFGLLELSQHSTGDEPNRELHNRKMTATLQMPAPGNPHEMSLMKRSRFGLVPKRVPIHRYGKVYYGIRWVRETKDAPDEPERKHLMIENESLVRSFNERIKEFRRDWDLETLASMYSTSLPDFAIQLMFVLPFTVEDSGMRGLLAEMHIEHVTDIDGHTRYAGLLKREFHLHKNGDMSVLHLLFKLESAHQNLGLAADINEYAEKWYMKHGIKFISLVANEKVGGYAWARQGYDFATERDRENIIWRGEKQIENLKLDRMTKRRLVQELSGLKRAWDFASWNPLNDPWGEHLGKQIMIGSEWNGVKHLDPNSIGFQIGQAYYREARKRKASSSVTTST